MVLPLRTVFPLGTVTVLILSASDAAYATKFWKNGVVNGNWNTGNNWSVVSATGVDNGGIPILNEVVNIAPTNGATHTISYDIGAPNLGALTVDLTGAGVNRTTFNQTANSLTTTGFLLGSTGRATWNHSGGTVTGNNAGLDSVIGVNLTGNGIYNLSDTGSLSLARDLYVGGFGTGLVTQTGGTADVAAALRLGNQVGSSGAYNISGGLLTADDAIVGNLGIGMMTIGGGGVDLNDQLTIGSQGTLNFNSGTLRFGSFSNSGTLNYTGGALQLVGDRNFGDDPTIQAFFGVAPTIPAGKALTVEGTIRNAINHATVSVNGGSLTETAAFFDVGRLGSAGTLAVTNAGTVTANGSLRVGNLGVAGTVSVSGAGSSLSVTGDQIVGNTGFGMLNVNASGTVNCFGSAFVVADPQATNSIVTITGAGSSWTINNNLSVGASTGGTMNVQDQGLVLVGNQLSINSLSTVNLTGGTLRFNSSSTLDRLNFTSGTIQLAGNRDVGADTHIQTLFGSLPTILSGKGLTVEDTATLRTKLTLDGGSFKSDNIVISPGADLDFERGTLELDGGTITGLSHLVVPALGEFRANGNQSMRITGLTGSAIAATGNLTLGNGAVNGFYSNGTLSVGDKIVTLADSNDAVFDSAALATLGDGGSPGTLNAANGLTLDFGGNITGRGTVSTPNNIGKPLINNGHITGNSVGQPITLPGYVKGVGTFDNVSFTGTFSPGLSPTALTVGNVALANTSTLVMELGGTSAGEGYDQILSTGALALDGTLQVSLINGFSPNLGQSFNLFDWVSTSGTFDLVSLPPLNSGLAWNKTQLYASGEISVVAGQPGDFDFDLDVDGIDFLIWQRGGSPAPFGQDDLADWETYYGAAPLVAAATAVPEPSGVALLLLTIGFARRFPRNPR